MNENKRKYYPDSGRAALACLTALSQGLDPRPLLLDQLKEQPVDEGAAFLLNMFLHGLNYSAVLARAAANHSGSDVNVVLESLARINEEEWGNHDD